MTTNPSEPIVRQLTQQRGAISEEWMTELMAIWNRHYPKDVDEGIVRQLASRLLTELAAVFAAQVGDAPPEMDAGGALAITTNELSAGRARAGFKPTDTAQFVLVLKNVLTTRLVAELSDNASQLAICLRAMDDVLDRLSLLTFEAYVETRENIISQQSLSLMELSTPVIRLWDQVLILPMIGVIDTLRARQFTERLLESIARYEALVTIIDITGVPVVDTSVARHIMKTVDAAQLLGTRIIMTGISPAGALTLTKLGVGFEGVLTRASLRAGVAEALKAIGRRIVPIDEVGK
jgi:rsbT co-antagonist protein RsbR